MSIGVILIGIILLANGILILKRKRCGPKEGVRGNPITGKGAIIAGIVITLFGAIVIIVGIILPILK